MRRSLLRNSLFTCGIVLLLACARVAFAAEPALPEKIDVPQLRTSVYIGHVTLGAMSFERSGETFVASYNARVVPWTAWSERGKITIDFPDATLRQLMAGDRVELTGKALTEKNKTHEVSVRATPADASGGKIKVRVHVSGATLIFNGTYRFAPPSSSDEAAPAAP